VGTVTELTDRVCVVTGAGHGIGAATAQLFARREAIVVVADVDADAGRDTVSTIADAGGTASLVATDVRSADDVDALRRSVLDRYGRVDVLVNNVGHWVRVTAFEEGGPAHWQRLYEVNLLQVFRLTDAFLPSMLERRSGVILNVSSNEGVRGYPQDPIYSAFKAAVIQFTKSLAVGVAGRGVRVNGIAPDVTATQQSDFPAWDPPEWADKWPTWVPVGRMGHPMDQARALLFLATEASGFIAGETILVDGGTTAAGGWYPTTHRPNRTWTNRPLDP
jgi:NAD(P)-dependent dehydrogenase (short-subunit alcohol dehydrogenase family)